MTTMPRPRRLAAVLVAAATAVTLGIIGVNTVAQASSTSAAQASSSSAKPAAASLWVDSWAAAPQSGDQGVPTVPVAPPFANQTLRLIEHPHASGTSTRIALSNTFGTQAVVIGQVTVANQTSGASIDATSARPVTFLGSPSVTIPAGGSVTSDAVPFTVTAGKNVAVDIYLPLSTGTPNGHLDAVQTSYVSTAGNHAGVASLPVGSSITSWFYLSEIQTTNSGETGVVAFGDSITSGHNSTVDVNHRWPDYLATDFAAKPATSNLVVSNEGISGGRLLYDVIGPSGLSRFNRDVLSKPDVHYVIVLIGVNDIGLPWQLNPLQITTSTQIIQGYQQLISQAHAAGLVIYGGTITPLGGSIYDNLTDDQERQQVNSWIRSSAGTPGGFDKVVDFDSVVRDPSNPTHLLPAYDSGDHLHPNDGGYAAMGAAAAAVFG